MQVIEMRFNAPGAYHPEYEMRGGLGRHGEARDGRQFKGLLAG